MTQTQQIHGGHRERVKKQFRANGMDQLDEVHALELLLFFCVPQGDTQPLARALLEHFGSFCQVLEAPPEELEKVRGVGSHVSTFLMLLTEASRYYQIHRSQNSQCLATVEAYGQALLPYFEGKRDEYVYMLCLDSKCKMICCRQVGQGSVNSAGVSVRRIVEIALSVNAVSVILAHNHPSGLAIPSKEDILTTRRMAVALDAVGVRLADHIVVADQEFVSLVDSAYYDPEEYRLIV